MEGLVIKQLDQRYRPGRKDWLKLRIRHTAEAIVGAVTGTIDQPSRLVLGLPAKHGGLTLAGTTTPLAASTAAQLGRRLEPALASHPWPEELPTGRLGGWASGTVPVVLVEPKLIVEVETDTAFEFGRWRHPTRFLRTREDLSPEEVSAPTH